MRIPPFYHLRTWQLFLFGAVMGGIIAWILFIYIFGRLQEEQTATIHKQQETIKELEREKSIWQEEFKKLNEKNNEMLTVQDLEVKIINAEKYKIDMLSKFETEELIKEDISMVLAKDLDFVFSSRELLKKTIENKPVKINDKRYQLTVKEMLIYTNLIINIEIKLAD